MKPAGSFVAKTSAILVLIVGLLYVYNRQLHEPVPDTALLPLGGHYQSPEFLALADHFYDIEIGIQAVPTAEAACLAVRPKTAVRGEPLTYPANQPCRALLPPMGAVDWVVKRAPGGEVVAGGTAPAIGWQWPRPFEIARAWYGIGRFRAKPGNHYVVILTLHDPQLPRDRYQPLFRVESPYDTL